jgi:hypothetical protein
MFQGVVYIMDREVVPRLCKICDYTNEQNVRVTMEFEVSRVHILRFALSIDMVQLVLQWERQKICSGSIKTKAHY